MENNTLEKTFKKDSDFEALNFKYEDILEMEIYLKEKIKWQKNVINDVVNIFANNIIRTEQKPISFVFSWPSWVWKNYLVKHISYFLQSKYLWWFKIFDINLSAYFTSEISSLTWVSSWFANSWDKCMFESIAEMMYDDDNEYGSVIVNFTEVDKIKANSHIKSKLTDFFSAVMQFLEERHHKFKWSSTSLKNTEIDTINIIYIFDGNFINDKIAEAYEWKIGFIWDHNLIKNDEDKYYQDNKVDINKLRNYFKQELAISIYNRISPWIIQFDEISDEVKYSIYKLEYKKMIEHFINRYKSENNEFLNEYLKPKKTDYNKMIKTLDKDSWARWIANYVNTIIKGKIIDDAVIWWETHKEEMKLCK